MLRSYVTKPIRSALLLPAVMSMMLERSRVELRRVDASGDRAQRPAPGRPLIMQRIACMTRAHSHNDF